MRIHRSIPIFLSLAIALSPGCSTLTIQEFVDRSERPADFQFFFNELDKAVAENKVKDAADLGIPGFPYLRANLFLVALKDKTKTDPQKEDWIESMRRLDLEDRGKEIQNLPSSAIEKLSQQFGIEPNRDQLTSKLSFYSKQMLAHDQSRPEFYKTLLAALNDLPSEYSIIRRTLGLYPLFAVPILLGTNAAQDSFREWHNKPFDGTRLLGKLKTFAPLQDINFSSLDLTGMFNPGKRDVLGIPQLTDEQMLELIGAFAPVYFQDLADDYDRFGEVTWDKDRVKINGDKPTVYYYVSNAFIKGEPVVQLNYVTWYSKRSGPKAPWLERGTLDGMTMRITLDSKGGPIMMDIMNNCGCYHFFVPNEEKVERVIDDVYIQDAFAPTWLPEEFPDSRIHLFVNSGWHQVEHIDTGDLPFDTVNYQLLPYDILESLPRANGGRESVFDQRGIMKGSSRIEPFFFFSSGIPSIGSMRQRGHHAIKMVGRAMFSDPNLFDRNFIFKK